MASTVSKQNKKLFGKRTHNEIHKSKLDSWAQGKNVYFTVENPNKEQTNMRFIKVTGKQLLGDYKKANILVPGKGR